MNHPLKKPSIIPFDLNKKDFVSQFGNVFENSPWIAERTFNKEISPSMNTFLGLHAALCFQFRAASKEERFHVLREHPDLAGKLANANQLTEESSREQKSAGLDQLSKSEIKEFTDLNSRYTKKFKFPFIMAVSGKDKSEILKSFYTRIDNEQAKEINTASEEVEKIALIRLKQIFKT